MNNVFPKQPSFILKNMPEGTQRNFEQNMQDALSILPKLKTGLDVNVKFTRYSLYDFEICSSKGNFLQTLASQLSSTLVQLLFSFDHAGHGS